MKAILHSVTDVTGMSYDGLRANQIISKISGWNFSLHANVNRYVKLESSLIKKMIYRPVSLRMSSQNLFSSHVLYRNNEMREKIINGIKSNF